MALTNVLFEDFGTLCHFLSLICYEDPCVTAKDVLEATKKFKSLKAVEATFMLKNGSEERRLVLKGVIHIQTAGASYSIPLRIWIPFSYPGGTPEIFVKPSRAQPIQPHPCFINETGEVNIFWMDSWGHHEGICGRLVDLIDELAEAFHQRIPVTLGRSAGTGAAQISTATLESLAMATFSRLGSRYLRPLSSEKEIQNALKHGQYLSISETTDQVLNAANMFDGVQPFTDYFKLNNGNVGEFLVGLNVQLRITRKRTSFRILVVIWLPKNYPVGVPTICVKPSDYGHVNKATFHIGKNGVVSNVLDFNDHHKPTNLVELIDLLCAKLSYTPPHYLHHDPEPSPEEKESPVPSDPRRRVPRKTGCLICFKSLVQAESWRMLEPEALVKKCKMLRALCHHMMFLHQDQIPEVISEEMFPFCGACEQLVETLWECHETIRKAHLKLTEVTHNIEQKVVECHDSASVPPTPKERRFIKFRDFIYEDHQKKMGLENHLNNNHYQDSTSSLTESKGKSAAVPPNEDSSSSSSSMTEGGSGDNNKDTVHSNECIATHPSPPIEESPDVLQQNEEHSAPVKKEVDVQERTIIQTDFEFYNDPFFEEVHGMVKIEINQKQEEDYSDSEGNGSADEDEGEGERFFGGRSGTQSLNADISLPLPIEDDVTMSEGKLLVNGCVDIYWIRTFRNDHNSSTYLKCSICHEILNMTSEEGGMEEGFKNMEEHVLNSHKEKLEEMVLRFGIREPHPCPWSGCPILFADEESRDKHEGAHRTCDKCGKEVGRKGNSEKMNQCALMFHKRSHDNPKTKKRKGEGGAGKLVARKKTKRH